MNNDMDKNLSDLKITISGQLNGTKFKIHCTNVQIEYEKECKKMNIGFREKYETPVDRFTEYCIRLDREYENEAIEVLKHLPVLDCYIPLMDN